MTKWALDFLDELANDPAAECTITSRQAKALFDVINHLQQEERHLKWTILSGLLETMALLFDVDETKLYESDFHEYLSVNELGLALDELAAVVNGHGLL